MQRTKVKELLTGAEAGKEILLKGWVRSKRGNKFVNFIAVNDGSTIHSLQVVADLEKFGEEALKDVTTGASVAIKGELVASQGKGQAFEVQASTIEVLGKADPETYPLQKKAHSLEYLREIAHLRFRTNTFGAVFRVRNTLAFAVHKFFNERGFVYMHTPIVTASDAEGAGETFRVTTFDPENPPRTPDGQIDYKEDFFGRATNLTVSGQLEGELAAMAFSDIYTFGPTFRAENSNTARHLAEFWMIEPEMAFYDLKMNADLAEDFIRYLIKEAIEKNADDIEFLGQRLVEEDKAKPQQERQEMTLMEKLNFVVNNDFERITYTKAVEILLASPAFKKKKFQYDVSWGVDLHSEHERYLVEKHFKKPVIVTDYPKEIKAFYMRLNDDGKTVAAMDILAPGIGEIVGGSQREERLELLVERMKGVGIHEEELWWYLDTRRFGGCPHAGFGLGFERLVQFVTGMGNIRDVIPFPRTPKNAEF